MMTDVSLLRMQLQEELYQECLNRQYAHCVCNMATEAENQRLNNMLYPPLMSLDEIKPLVLGIPYKVPNECCDDGSSMRPRKTNCVNCGAALRGHKCVYCDTYNE